MKSFIKNNRITFQIILNFLSFTFFHTTTLLALQSQLMWPLKIPIIQSSSFGEYRGLRFHAGIDIKTFQRTGYPVFAIADGFVSRIKIQHRGGGYSIYIDHPNLNIRSLYAHLESYAEPMNSFVKDLQKKTGRRYEHDILLKPNQFTIRKGQLIGYSGESGLGPPHLHFELRNFDDEPFSPSLLGFIASDSSPAQFTKLFIEPFSWNSIINDNFLPLALPITKLSSSTFTIHSPIKATGKFAFYVGLIDYGDKGSKFGVETIEFYLNGKQIFKRTFNNFNYDHNKYAQYIYDYYKSEFDNSGFVYNLFKNPQDNSYFSKDLQPWQGIVEIDTGFHNFEIVAKDFAGNKSTLTFSVFSNNKLPNLCDLNQVADSLKFLSNELIKFSKIYYLCNSLVIEYAISKPIINSELKETTLPIKIKENNIIVSLPISDEFVNNELLFNKLYILPHKYCDKRGNTLKFESEKETITIHFASNTLSEPILAGVTVENKKVPSQLSEINLQPISKVYRFYPPNLVSYKPFKVQISLPFEEIHNNPKQLGIFSINNSNNLTYLGGIIDGKNISIETRNISLPIIVLRDKIPPVVKYIGKRYIKNLGKCLVFNISDIGKGIDWYNNKAYLQNITYDIDSDPDKKELYVIYDKQEKIKSGILTLIVYDLAGNKTAYQLKL